MEDLSIRGNKDYLPKEYEQETNRDIKFEQEYQAEFISLESCKSCKGLGLRHEGGYAVDCKILSKLKDLVDFETFKCSEHKKR